MKVLSKFINKFCAILGKIIGIFFINFSKEKKRTLINTLEKHSVNFSPKLYGKFYHLFYQLIKQITKNEKDFFIIIEIAKNIFMDLDIKKKTQRLIFLQRPYEGPIRHYIENHLKVGDIFLDIGANVGYYTLLAAAITNKTGKVIAFEPEEDNFSSLTNNIEINKFQNIEAFKVAVGEKEEEKELNLNPLNEGGHSLKKEDFYSDDQKTLSKEDAKKHFPDFVPTQNIRVIGLDDYFSKFANSSEIPLIKIDVESYEYEVFLGMKKLLQQGRIKRIICEISQDNSPVFDIVSKHQYLSYRFSNFGLIKQESVRGRKGNYLFEKI